MPYFDLIQRRDHEGVFFCNDKASGLKAFIAIHNTALGPALGGCRMKAYKTEEEALKDALRLSRAMSYKSSVAGLNLGGGKSVVILDSPEQKTPELLRAFAERIKMLKGTYIGAGDVGSNTHDLKLMHDVCPHIVGLEKADGGLGDSAILTALGVFMGIKASVKEKLGRDDLDGLKIAIQGAGKVGHLLVGHLINAGCTVYIADINQTALNAIKDEFPSVEICDTLGLFDKEVDVFSPNAIGGLVNAVVAHGVKTKIIAGGANNPLADASVAKTLHERGILYAPDFVINAGGIIMVYCELHNLGFEEAEKRTKAIYDTTLRVFDTAKQQNILPWEAAQKIAVDRIEAKRVL